MNRQIRWNLILTIVALVFTIPMIAAADDKPIAIAKVDQKAPVDFEKQVLPILRRNCLACHNSTEHEGGLILETPKSILKGGDDAGPAAIAGKADKSPLLLQAARRKESYMPPEDNDVGAKPLTPKELGLIKLWIDQGAKGEVKGSGPIVWQPLPAGVNPIYAVAIDANGQYAAAGRANQVFLHHVPSGQLLGRLTDPSLLKKGSIYTKPGVAMLDLVQSLAFAPDGRTLAVGGYRTVKFWQRPTNVVLRDLAKVAAPVRSVTYNPAGTHLAVGLQNGQIQLVELASGKVQKTLQGHAAAVTGIGFSADGKTLVSGSEDKTLRSWQVADGKQIASLATPTAIHAVAMVTKATQVAIGGDDNTIRIWAIPTPQPTPKPAPKKEAATKKDATKKDAKKPVAKKDATKKDATKKDAKKPAAKKVEPPKPIRELKGHGGAVTALAILGETQLVSGSKDGTARIWTVSSGKQVRSLSHGGPVDALAVAPDGKRISTASSNKVAKLFDATNGKLIAELRGSLQQKLTQASITRSAALAAKLVANSKKDLDAAKKRKTAEEGNQKKATDAKKKADDNFKMKDEAAKKAVAAKAAADKKATDATAKKAAEEKTKTAIAAQIAKQPTLMKAAQAALAKATADAGKSDTEVRVAQVTLKAVQEAAKKDAKNKDLAAAVAKADAALKAVQAAKLSTDKAKTTAQQAVTAATKMNTDLKAKQKANALAITAATNMIKTLQAAAKKLEAPTKKATDEKTAAQRAAEAANRSLTRAKEAVKKAMDAIPPIEAIIKTQEAAQKAEAAKLATAKAAVTAAEIPLLDISFSKDGKTIATVDQNGVVSTWSGATGAAIESYRKDGFKATAAVFSADNDIVAFAANQTALIWKTNPEWKLVRTIGNASESPFVDRVTALNFSRDGQFLATGGGEPSRSGEIKIWKVADGSLVRELKEPHSDTVFSLEFSRDGKFLASCAADRFVKVFNVADGKHVRSFEGHTHHVLGVSWSADGRVLASSGADKQVKIWDFRTGDQRRSITNYGKEVTAIRFVGDSDNIVSACGDKNVYIKRISNGGNVASLSGSTDFVYSVSVSDDGNTIVAGGQDSALRVWDAKGKSMVIFAAPAPAKTAATAASGG